VDIRAIEIFIYPKILLSVMMKKRGVVLLCLVVLSFLIVSCKQGEELSLATIWGKILDIGSLTSLGLDSQTTLAAFLRIMVGILVFALFFEGARLLPFSQNIRVTLAIVLSVLSIVLIPGTVLIAISAAYSTVVATALISIPVVGAFYAVYRIPSTNRGQIAAKIFILIFALAIIMAIKEYATGTLGL